MQNIIRYIILIIVITLILSLISIAIKKNVLKKEVMLNKQTFTIKPSIFYLIVGIVGFVFLNGMIVLMYTFQNETSSILIAIVFGLFSLAGLYLVIFYVTHRIIFLKDKIIEIKLLMKREILLSSISSAKLIGNPNSMVYELKLYIDNKKVISITSLYIGYNLAVERIKESNISLTEHEYNSIKDLLN